MSRMEAAKGMGAFDLLDTQAQEHLLAWIKENLFSVQAMNYDHGSASLKRVFDSSYPNEERFITEWEFRGAMVKSGFEYRDENGQWYFNLSKKSPALVLLRKK